MTINLMNYSRDMLLCSNKGIDLFYHCGAIYIYDKKRKEVISRFRINKKVLSIAIVSRLLRRNPRAAIALDKYTFLFTYHGVIYRISASEDRISVDHTFSKGMNNPLSFCTRYDDDGKLIDLLYGEYIGNSEKGPVSIYRRSSNGWSIIYDFPSKTIQHIHNIFFDKYKNRYLILTGDSDSESGIWEADVDFKKVSAIIRGSQKYRACVLLPTKDGIYYVTDTPLEKNYVCWISNNGEYRKLHEIAGPCIYGIEKDDDLYFATSVEGDSSFVNSGSFLDEWRYRISYKLGNGVKDRYSHLYKLSMDGSLKKLCKVKKDLFPMWLFEFGTMKFPQSDDNSIYICPQSLMAKYGTYMIKD